MRYLDKNRSLFRWLRGKTDVLLRTNALVTAFVPYVSNARASDLSTTVTFSDSPEVTETTTTAAFGDLVSMDTNVRFAGLIVHIVEVDFSEPRNSTPSFNDEVSVTSPSK